MAKKDLIAEAKSKGLDVNEKMTVAQLTDLLEKAESDAPARRSAGVEGRSADAPTDVPLDEQTNEGEFVRVFVTSSDTVDESRLISGTINQAIQQGMRPTGEASVSVKDGRATVTIPVRM